jgi:hypothetical protein
MKKAVMILALLCCTLSGFAEKKPIELEENKRPHKRSEVQLPTASIDGLVLTIEFSEATASQVTVKGQSTQVVVYNGAFTSGQVVITLPSLSEGGYCLEIEQGDYVYIGEFDVE